MRRLAVVGLAGSLMIALGMQAAPAGRSTAATPAAAGPQDYRFPSGAGMLFFYVKPDKTADFEAVVARLAEVLDRVEDPIRKQQAAAWRILKSVEAQRDAAIYVFVFDPAVADADYDPIKVLGEGLPSDVQSLYEHLREATVKVERMGLRKIR